MKKTILTLAIVAISATVLGCCAAAASASTSASSKAVFAATEIHTHTATQGKHCSGTVGCDCSGFSPITNGKEWQKSYCKHCGHKKSCHR